VTLIELFAWLTETTLYRLNRMPERHYIKFMEMLGIRLKAPIPAKVPVTFWLSAPVETEVTIPAGTEIASTQTETERSIVFTTDLAFTIVNPVLKQVMTETILKKSNRFRLIPNLTALANGLKEKHIPVFSKEPEIDDALYFGFENNVGSHILRFDTEWNDAGGRGCNPELPPYVWEAATDNSNQPWQPCYVEQDVTKAFNNDGHILLHLPQMVQLSVNGQKLYWVRVRVKQISAAEQQEGMRPYSGSPLLRKVTVAAHGGIINATHAQTMRDEFLGQSDGSAGQRFHLQVTPVLERHHGEHLLVHVSGQAPQAWSEVKDFADSDGNSRHYTLDSVTGELRFGPAMRQPDGAIKLYGAIPPRGANLIFKQYRYGGGEEGNVDAGVINTLKTAIPYVRRVRNQRAAEGGFDKETLANAMVRAPEIMRHRDRAVTAADYEDLAMETPNVTIGRVRCLQPKLSEGSPVALGQIYILVIPWARRPEGYLTPDDLDFSDADRNHLETFLDERRLLTTRLLISKPDYRWVTARVRLRANPDVEQTAVEVEILARLYRFINPLTGGERGQGWPFGRDLFVSDVYQSLQGVTGVQFIRSVELFIAEPGGGPQGEPVEVVEVVAHGVVASGRHEVVFV
jgi:predicted phage baseplate assembly protein